MEPSRCPASLSLLSCCLLPLSFSLARSPQLCLSFPICEAERSFPASQAVGHSGSVLMGIKGSLEVGSTMAPDWESPPRISSCS